MHGIHHSIVPEEVNSNWSSGLTLWDWLHGALKLNVPQQEITIGVAAIRSPAEAGLLKPLRMPFQAQWDLIRLPGDAHPSRPPELSPVYVLKERGAPAGMRTADFSDPEFLRRLRTRDTSALEDLVNVYLPHLIRTSQGMGFTREECEDLAQSAFLSLIESVHRFEARSRIRTFIFGIFYHNVSEYLRSKQHDPEHDDIDTVVASRFDRAGKWIRPPADLERRFHSQEIGSIIDECLNSLPLAHRSAFVLREVEGLSTAEIRKILNVTATNLGVMLFRARNRLRECVERNGLRRG